MKLVTGALLILALSPNVSSAQEKEAGEKSYRCWRIEPVGDAGKLKSLSVVVEAHSAREAIETCASMMSHEPETGWRTSSHVAERS